MSLDRLVPGDRARVQQVRARGAVAQRLCEMGLFPGTEIEVIRRAPLGDPTEYRIEDYHLSLRSTEAALVEVDVRTPQP